MARHLSQTLTLTLTKHLSLSSRFVFPKPFSTKPQLIELDLGSVPGDGEVLGLNRLEDAIHGIVVRRLAPDWLPFRPGSSYWVPSKPHALGILGNSTISSTEEGSLSKSSSPGWPCPSYFVQAGIPVEVEVDVEVEVKGSPVETETVSGDEEP